MAEIKHAKTSRSVSVFWNNKEYKELLPANGSEVNTSFPIWLCIKNTEAQGEHGGTVHFASKSHNKCVSNNFVFYTVSVWKQ